MAGDIPSFLYPGGKYYLREWIASYFPAWIKGRYVEPFAGRGSVFWYVSSIGYTDYWLNDIRTVPFFRLLVELSERDIELLVGNAYPSRKDYEYFCHNPHLPQAILLEPLITYSGAGWREGHRYQGNAKTVRGYKRRLKNASRVLRETKARITDWDYRRVLAELGEDDFAYLDPPYYRGNAKAYHASDIEHSELVSDLKLAPYRWVLSEYYEPFYVEAFGEPYAHEKVKSGVAVRAWDNHYRIECLWLSPLLGG